MPVNLQKKWLTIAVNHLKIITKQIRLFCFCKSLIYRYLQDECELFFSAVLLQRYALSSITQNRFEFINKRFILEHATYPVILHTKKGWLLANLSHSIPTPHYCASFACNFSSRACACSWLIASTSLISSFAFFSACCFFSSSTSSCRFDN